MDNEYDPTHWGVNRKKKTKKSTPKLKLLNELMKHINSVVYGLKPRYIDTMFLQMEGRAYAIHFIDQIIPGYEVKTWQEQQVKELFYDHCERYLQDINENHRLALETKEFLKMEINDERTQSNYGS